MTDEFDPDPPPARPWWRGPIVWGLVLSIAIVVYELTAQPALAVVTVSLKMGWGRFTTAAWLLRRDPNRARGRACFWLYLGSGFWFAAVTGFALFLLIPFAIQQPGIGAGNNGGVAVEAFIGSAIAWFAGADLAAVCFLLAALLAWRNGLHLWLHPDVSRARDRNEWPPTYGDTNRMAFPVTVSVGFLFLTVANVAAVILIQAFGGPGGPPQNPLVGFLFLIWIGAIILATLKVGDVLRDRVYARMPGECWNDKHPMR